MKTISTFFLSVLFILQINAQCYTTVSAGLGHVLAIKSNGTLWGWGDNGYGQLGDGTTINKSLPVQIGTAQTGQKLKREIFILLESKLMERFGHGEIIHSSN